ncbi:hypothetical protein WBP07_13000 [Novosphingobium sp. BL-8A]
MTDWVRLWHDMPTDPKWRVIARKSGQPLPCVIAVFNLMMVNASGNAEQRGTLSGWDDEDAGAALDMDAADVEAIRTAMQGKVLDDDRLTGWSKRQPKREDGTAAQRKQAWKEREAAKNGAEQRSGTHRNASGTASERSGTHRNAPETETETETDIPFSNENGPAAVDPSKIMFDAGVALLAQSGKAESTARAWLAKARKAHGAEAVIAAIGAAKREGAIDPISFMEASLRARGRTHSGELSFTGPC